MPFFKVQNSKLDRFAFCDHLVGYKVQNYEIKSYANKPTFWFVSKKGFTLIELLVVMAIIGILATIMLANYNNFGARQEVKNAAAELKSNLRKYQTYALASQKDPDQSHTCTDGGEVLEYYSINITSSNYQPTVYCPPEPNPSITLPTVSFSAGITATLSHSATPCNSSIEVRFRPINQSPELYCDGVAIPAGEDARIEFQYSSASYFVSISHSGEIQ